MAYYEFTVQFEDEPVDDEAATHWFVDTFEDLEFINVLADRGSLRRVTEDGTEPVDVRKWWDKWVQAQPDQDLRDEEAAKLNPPGHLVIERQTVDGAKPERDA